MKPSTLRIHSNNVYAGDTFEIDTEAHTVSHSLAVQLGPRVSSDIVAAYAFATRDDRRLVVEVNKSEIDAVAERKPLVWARYPHTVVRELVINKMITELKRIGVWT